MFLSRFFKFAALERRVFLVAVAGLLPVAVLSCALFISSASERRDKLLSSSEDTMVALLSAVDAELKSTSASLDALASSPRLARGDFEAVREEALELLGRRPGWLNVVIADADKEYVNARIPADQPLPAVTHPELIRETLERGTPMMGEVVYAPLLRRHAVAVLVPYKRKGRPQFVIAAVVQPEYFLGLLDPLEIQKSSTTGVIAIFDRKSMIVARSLNQEKRVGGPASPTLLRLLERGYERGKEVTTTIEGVPVYTVFRRSASTRWTTAVGIPRATVDGPVTRSYLMLGAAVAMSVLLGLVAATLVGRTIVRPMSELEASAERMGRGEPPGLPRTRLAEVQRVGAALARAHDERTASFQREHEARVAAETASKAKDEFLAMLGHELRNPLAAITNATHLIERQKPALDSSAATATGIIARQARHLTRLTDDLLDAGRVILGKISLTRVPLDLAAAVTAVFEGMRSTGRIGDHQFDLSIDHTWVFADATRIDQIVGNLLTNAIKYTPAGGRISVSTRRDGAQSVLVVSDTGIGLEPELLPRAFDLFVQGERSLDRAQGGLGIGLTLVRRLTELHGGTVLAESAGRGRGATFTVRLPAIEAPLRAGSPRPEVASQGGQHIAIVEDNDDARDSLRMLLELEGHTVHEAPEGAGGVELIAGDPRIGIAFVDIGLPGMSGFEVASAVRQKRGRGVRLVAMSGYGADRDVTNGLEAGFDAYIVKPADLDAIRSEIEKMGTVPIS
jgi:signal transduction histidine kinase